MKPIWISSNKMRELWVINYCPCANLSCVALQMKDSFSGSKTHCVRHLTPEPTICDSDDSCNSPQSVGIQSSPVSALTPLDPIRQAKRLPIRILKMLTAHSHLLHPEYLQPLTSASVSIEVWSPIADSEVWLAVRAGGQLLPAPLSCKSTYGL